MLKPLALFALAFSIAEDSTGPIPLNCNRACLENVIRTYLTAMAAHSPAMTPLSADVLYTENDQQIPVGEATWKTLEGLGNYTHVFADPEGGQVAFMGTLREAGGPILASVRCVLQRGAEK